MGIGVFLAVLFAALLHASWNALIKFGDDKVQGMFLLSLGHTILGLILICVYPVPLQAAWGWLALSVLFHTIYKLALTYAYSHGDLSRVYPIARGTAPMLVLLVGGLFIGDVITQMQVTGIIGIGFGILLMARGVFTGGESRKLLPFALLSAAGTAGYSVADGLGARASGSVSGYVGWLFLFDAVIFMIWGYAVRGRSILSSDMRTLTMGLFAGFASVAAYWIAVWAMTVAPIALVTALRETSVMFAVLLGVLFLGERADKGKLLAVGVIVAGVILTRI